MPFENAQEIPRVFSQEGIPSQTLRADHLPAIDRRDGAGEAHPAGIGVDLAEDKRGKGTPYRGDRRRRGTPAPIV